jgi:hypothetical protein
MVAGFVVEQDDRIRACGPDVEVHNGSSGGQAQLRARRRRRRHVEFGCRKGRRRGRCLRERRQYRNGKAHNIANARFCAGHSYSRASGGTQVTTHSRIAFRSAGRLCLRYAKTHHQKSKRSRDRRIARHAQRGNEKSSKMTISAARRRGSTTSSGPRSPSMIHFSFATRRSCAYAHSFRDVARRPGCQKNLSSSTTGRPVISPRRFARVDLPDAPRPRITTRFILRIVRHTYARVGSSSGSFPWLAIARFVLPVKESGFRIAGARSDSALPLLTPLLWVARVSCALPAAPHRRRRLSGSKPLRNRLHSIGQNRTRSLRHPRP